MADRARQKTDRLLNDLERRIKDVYASDPALKRIQKRYDNYMKRVEELAEDEYLAYKREPDRDKRRELKKVYSDKVKKLTIKNVQYKAIISELTKNMARVNQEALNLVNAEMQEIYMLNYNQVATDCRNIGIEVIDNGD